MDFLAVRGDTLSFTATVTQSAAPVDLTAAQVWFTAKHSATDADPGIFQKTIGSGIAVSGTDHNLLTITVDPADTAGLDAPTTLHWDLQIKEAGGRVTTVAGGTIALAADITRAT